MFTEILLTGVSAVALGFLAVPVTRNSVLGEIEHDWLADELELDCIEPDNVTVRIKDGPYFRVFKLRGISYDAKVLSQQDLMLKGREALIHDLGSKGISPYFFGIKRQNDISFKAKWPSPALEEIGQAEHKEFKSSFQIDWFIVISTDTMKALIEGCTKVVSSMSKYRPLLQSRPEDRTEPCELTGFLNYLVCGEYRKDLLAVSENISGNLPASDFTPNKITGTIRTFTPTPKFHKVIVIREWPESVSGRLFVDLLALQGDIEISQLCDPMERNQATLLYARMLKEHNLPLIGNSAAADESSAVLSLLSEGNTTLFHTQVQIIVRSDDEHNLELLVGEVCKILGDRRVKHAPATAGAPLCWFNRIPRKKRTKMPGATDLFLPLILQAQNIGALWSFNHAPTGMMKSPYGNLPVRYLRTPSGQAFAFQFHVLSTAQALGNYMVFAPAGSGKSTLIMHLLGGLSKFENVRSYIFDSKEGAKFMVETMGGLYQSYEDLQLNPLDVGEDNSANRHRVYSVLRSMAGNEDLNHDDEAALAHAVEIIFSLEPPERTLNAIFDFAFAKQTNIRRLFSRWVTDSKGREGLDAHVFNAPHDSLGGLLNTSHMVGINMNEALDDPILGPPVVAHISEAIYKSASNNTKGFNIFIDEAAKLLQNEGFLKLAAEMYREYRKLNGSVGMAFQDPAALFRTGMAEAFLENTTTLFFFPNSLASRESLAPFNLNEEQIGFILGGEFHDRKVGSRQVLIVQRDASSGFDESAILDVDLTPLGNSLRFYRAGTDANKHLAALKNKWGTKWQNHL